jgi:DNA adenine methylase
MLKAQGKRVLTNDYMAMSHVFAKAMVENDDVLLSHDDAAQLLLPSIHADGFVESTFKDLYFTQAENRLIDQIRANSIRLSSPKKRAIAKAALIRACLKKRPRGIFTYVGHRYDDGRKDLRMSFEEQYLDAVRAINGAIFEGAVKGHKARWGDAMSLEAPEGSLVYMDPPYYSPFSDNEYVRRYHFVEGLARDWEGVTIQEHTKTKKFKSYPTPFSTLRGAYSAFDSLFRRFQANILLVSYSSNSLPTLEDMVELMSKYKPHVDVIPIDYRYSFGTQSHKKGDNRNNVQEYLFVGY